MAVNVKRGGNIGMTQTLLRDLDVHALHQHDRSAQVSEIMESTFRKTCSVLQFREHLTKISRINRLAVGMNDNKIGNRIPQYFVKIRLQMYFSSCVQNTFVVLW